MTDWLDELDRLSLKTQAMLPEPTAWRNLTEALQRHHRELIDAAKEHEDCHLLTEQIGCDAELIDKLRSLLTELHEACVVQNFPSDDEEFELLARVAEVLK